jgi:pimeloyl-ACP methyl ester carboxylesterase
MTLVESRRFLAGKLSLAADIAGPEGAPTVVLLHGGGQTRHSWRGTLDRLAAAGFRVIAYDARGHGESDWAPDGDYSIPALASDLCTVLESAAPSVSLVGASMGGMTALYAAGMHHLPSVRAIVLVDIVLRPSPEGTARIVTFMRAHPEGFASIEDAADAVAAYYPERPRPRDSAGLTKNLRRHSDGRLHWHWDPLLLDVLPRPEPPEGEPMLAAAARQVHVPALLVRGGRSDVVDDAGVADLIRAMPQIETIEVGGAGHMVVGDNNDVFADSLIEFLRRNG